MRIAQIAPGAGDNIYCENCLRDAALARALGKLGHEVLIIPLYLPLQTDPDQQSGSAPIFFGGINVYLQQKLSFFRKTPRWIDKIFDRRKLLKWAARKSQMVNAQVLGQTTISMLQGADGRQAKELQRLVDWLNTDENKPDIICLSNVLLAGIAGQIRQATGAAVVCLLQDENKFLDELAPPYSQQAWELLSERSRDIDAFIAVSNYYGDVMKDRLKLEADKLQVICPGIPLDQYVPAEAKPKTPTIGYLSQLCSAKGLDILVEAFIEIKKKRKLKETKLLIAGRQSNEDKDFTERIKQRLKNHDLLDDVEIMLNIDHKEKIEFLRRFSVLSVPEKTQTAYALYILEALAMAVPVVEPVTSVFTELLAQTGGGVLYEPNKPAKLAETLEKLLLDPDYSARLGRQGRDAVLEKFNIDTTAEKVAAIFTETVKNFSENDNA